jgi:hypothetical protein
VSRKEREGRVGIDDECKLSEVAFTFNSSLLFYADSSIILGSGKLLVLRRERDRRTNLHKERKYTKSLG